MQEKGFYKFGPFRIDPEERLLRRGEEAIPLAPKAVDTLLVMLAEAGRVLKKDELMKMVWPDTFVEEGGLARNVYELRRVLGDGYIETHAKQGYRFIAKVEWVLPGPRWIVRTAVAVALW